jgi:hypothetical protein
MEPVPIIDRSLVQQYTTRTDPIVTKDVTYEMAPPPGDPKDAGEGVGHYFPEDTGDIYLDPYYGAAHLANWFPSPDRVGLVYGEQGVESSSQTWIAPFWVFADNGEWVPLQVPLRQLMSWNREKYQQFNRFADHPVVMDGTSYPTENYMVPIRLTAKPRIDMPNTKLEELYQKYGEPTSYGMFGYAGIQEYGEGFAADYFRMTRFTDGSGNPLPEQNTFPSILGQWWEIEIQFATDKYFNRFGYRYCKIDIKPTTRMESIKNIPIGIVPTDVDGNPNFKLVDAEKDGDSSLIDNVTVGFPLREGQIEITMTYPWVSINDLLKAGPIGNPTQIPDLEGGNFIFEAVNPHNMSPGQFLGTVNTGPFLGFPRGRVLYSAAEIEEARSPVTGEVGYKVSNHFMVNTLMEWNQVRYMPKDKNADVLNDIEPDMTPSWPTGFMVLMDKSKGSNIIYKFLMNKGDGLKGHAVYPYPYRDWENVKNDPEKGSLVYYGRVDTTKPFNPFESTKA